MKAGRSMVMRRIADPVGWMTSLPSATSRTGITWTSLTSGFSDSTGLAFTTASVAPVADRPIYAAFAAGQLSNPSAAEPAVTGNGLTWVKVFDSIVNSNYYRLSVYRSCGAAPSAGAVTITYVTETREACAWAVFQAAGSVSTGTHGSGSVVQAPAAATGSGTAPTQTIAALADPLNHHVAITALASGTRSITADATFTSLASAACFRTKLNVAYAANDTSVTGTIDGAGASWNVSSFEVKAA